MKKFIVFFSFLFTVAATTSFAGNNSETGRSPGAEEVFKKEFPAAQNISWTQQGEYQQVTFVLLGHRVIAFYNKDNELAGCIRGVFFDQLPISVIKAVETKFPGAVFEDIREIWNSNGTSYLLLALLNEKTFLLRVTPDGNITDVDKKAN